MSFCVLKIIILFVIINENLYNYFKTDFLQFWNLGDNLFHCTQLSSLAAILQYLYISSTLSLVCDLVLPFLLAHLFSPAFCLNPFYCEL